MSSFGEELRRERELREITLREVAEATKISLRYLEALEQNDFAHLPGGVFNKGFVRAYCQFIGIDPESMVNAYLLEERAQAERAVAPRQVRVNRRREAAEASVPPVTPHAEPQRAGSRAIWLVAILGALLLVAALWLYLRLGVSA